MRKTAVAVSLMVLAFTAALWPFKSAQAYFDPGTGSLLVQSLIGALIAVGAGVGVFWDRVQTFFAGLKKKSREDDAANHHDNNAPSP